MLQSDSVHKLLITDDFCVRQKSFEVADFFEIRREHAKLDNPLKY